MLKPNKYTNISLSVIGLSSSILEILYKENTIKYELLLNKVILDKGILAKENFLESITFLYSLGKLEYYKNSDSIKLTL